MERNKFDIPEEEFYDIIVNHIKDLNRGLVELHQNVQTSLAQIDQMDYQHNKLGPYSGRR